MSGVIRTVGLRRLTVFAHATGRYWLNVFPAVAQELRRRHELAFAIPDPVLRRLALQALECKRCNLEGAATFELLAGRERPASLIRTLSACQTMCDYLDLLAEQPTLDPVAAGACLHQAVTVALTPGEPHRDYYALHPRSEDGGYLTTLVEDVQAGLADLPALPHVQASLTRCAERVAAYQSFNHGDASGSYRQFEHWASAQTSGDDELYWWEIGGGAGSTLTIFALIACAVERLDAETVQAIERAYFPWIGALHSMLDSLADQQEDTLTGERGLIGCYPSPEIAAERVCAIASRALQHAEKLANGHRHSLLVAAMTGFYLCQASQIQSAYTRAVVPRLLPVVGGVGRTAMLMMTVRHAARRRSHNVLELPIVDGSDPSACFPVQACEAPEALEPCTSADGPCGE